MSVGTDTVSGLSRLGIAVKRDWLVTAERVLREKRVAARDLVDAVVEQFLFADLNVIGRKSLPQHVDRMHDCRLTGSFVLQVQEAFNMGEPLERRNKDTANTCLKLWLTDGHQRVVGFEYKKIGALKVETPVGYKLAIHDVMVKRGVLMLCPQTVCVLGGEVASLVKEQEKNRREQARRTQPYYIPGDCDDEDEEEHPPQRASLESYLYGSRGTSPSNGAAKSTGSKDAQKPKAPAPAPAPVASRSVAPGNGYTVLDLEEDSFDDRDSSMSPPPVTRNPVRSLPRARPQILLEDDIDQEMLQAIEEDIAMEDASGADTDKDLQMGACAGPASEKIGDDLLLELMEDTEKSEADVYSEDVHMADVEDEMDELDFDFDFEKPSFNLLDLPPQDELAPAPQVNYLVDILASSSPFEGTVRAAVRNSVSMLSVDGMGRYTATVTLEDGTAVCTAVLSSSVIQEHCLGGLSPHEYQRLKGAHTPEAKAKLTEAGQLLERNLAQMEGMMTLAFGSGAVKEPCQVLELRRPGNDDMDALFAAAGIERRVEKQAERRTQEIAEDRVEKRASPARALHPAVAPSPISLDDSPAPQRTSRNALYCSPRPSSPSPEESPIIVTSPLSKRGSQSPRHKLARSRRQIRRLIESDSDEELGSAVEDLLAGRATASSLVGSGESGDGGGTMHACAEGYFDEEKDSCGVAVVFGTNHPYNVSKSFEGGGSVAKASLLAIKVALLRYPKTAHAVVYSYNKEAVETMNTKMEAWRRTGFQGPNKQLLKEISRLEDKFAKPPTYALIDSSVANNVRTDALTASAIARQAL